MDKSSRRERLSVKETRDALEAIQAGARIVVVRPLPLDDGVTAMPGTDVTAAAKTWPRIRVLVARGHVRVEAGVSAPAPAAPPAPAPAAPPAPAPAAPPAPENKRRQRAPV